MNPINGEYGDDISSSRSTARRAFLAKASQTAIVAPAATLLLAATARQSLANPYGRGRGRGRGNGQGNGYGNGQGG